MINLFDVEGGVVKPTVHCHTIKWLKDIMDEFPDNYLKIYQYVFYMSYVGEQNPFFNVPETEKEDVISKAIDIDFSLDEPLIENAIKEAKKLYETPTASFYISLKEFIEKLKVHMHNSQIVDGKDGNLSDFLKIIKDYNSIRQTFKDTYNDLKDEESIRVRGDQQVGYDI